MGTRRANRESYLASAPDAQGYWRGAVWAGLKANGRPDRRWVRRKSKAARNKAVRELERRRDSGTLGRAGSKPTVEQLLTRHLDVVLPARRRAPRTIDGYRSVVTHHIVPALGAVRTDRLTAEDVEDFLAAMTAAGAAPSYVRKALAVLSSVFQDQVRRGALPRNPCWPVEPPEIGEPQHKALTRAQARAVLAAIEERRNAARWKVGLACGLRQGEALGLRWDFVGEDGLRVWFQLQRLTWRHGCDPACGRKRGADCPARHSGGLVLRQVKEKRRKTVAFGPLLGGFIAQHRHAQAAERKLAGDMWQDFGFTFCQPNGRPLDPRADWQEWHDILADAGVPHVGVHGGRHSFASLAIGEGVTLPVVQEMLGHTDVRVTRGYVDVASSMTAAAAGRVDRALFGLEGGGEDIMERFAAFLEGASPEDFSGPC